MKIRIGTRKSALAQAQTRLFVKTLADKFPDIDVQIIEISTHGDRTLDKPLSQLGGKGAFVAEIEQALLDGKIDAAVHSAKDMPIKTADGTSVAAVLARGSHRDALVTAKGVSFGEFDCFTVGTSSLRRMRNLSRSFPLAQYKDIRGNVDTRISKLLSGEYDAVILAQAGLERLQIGEDKITVKPFESDRFLPAPCQGIIAVQCAKGAVADIISQLDDEKTRLCFETEREVLRLLGADCTTPAGAYAQITNGKISLEISADGIEFQSDTADVAERFALAERLVSRL